MSRTVDFEIRLVEELGILRFVDRLREVHSLQYRGGVSYVIDSDDSYDWRNVTEEQFSVSMEGIRDSFHEGSTFGLTVMLEGQCGGDFLLHPGGREVSFLAEVNRRARGDNSGIADLGWYLDRLIPLFSPFGIMSVEARDLLE